MKRVLVIFCFFLVSGVALAADEQGKFSGLMFGDFYYIATNHDADLEGRNGFWFRRIYFTYDKPIGQNFDMRFRLETASAGDFSTRSVLTPFVKDAYLRWKKNGQQIIFGISPTPTWRLYEKIWGYRSVEKAPMDLQKYGSSRDFGIAALGKLVKSGFVRYHFMVANGSGKKSETDKGKKIMGALDFYPAKSAVLELYGDYELKPGDVKVFTVQVFGAVQAKTGRAGLMFAQQVTKRGNDSESRTLASVFGVINLSGRTNFFARLDRQFDIYPGGAKISYLPFDPTAKATLLILGIDLVMARNVRIQPNVAFITYDQNEEGVKPDSDLVPRLTFYYKF